MLLYEDGEGTTCVDYDHPSSLFGQFGYEDVDRVAKSLDRKPETLLTAAEG